MQVICVVNRVICGPVSAGLIPHLLRVQRVEVEPHNHKGIPALAGYIGQNGTETTGKTLTVV